MAPIGVGLIGLSGQPRERKEAGISWAAIAHLPYFKATNDYEIRALLNSSEDSAKAAIALHGLPASVKAYGDPEAFAADKDVDLVVCCVRVDRHFSTVRPSIVAGKAIYVEWPLDKDIETAKEMALLAARYNAKTIVGLQASFSPIIRKVKQSIAQGAIGRLLSSSVIGSLEHGGPTETTGTRFFLDRAIGGNFMTIHAAHGLEYITSALGRFETFHGACAIRWSHKDVVDPKRDNKVVETGVQNTVPDNILLHGTVHPSGAAVVINYTGGHGMPNLPVLDWRIQGETGWLRVTSSTMALNVGAPDTKLELYDGSSGKLETIDPDSDQWTTLPVPAQNIARLYEAYRKNEWYPDFDYALKRHEEIEAMWKDFDRSIGL